MQDSHRTQVDTGAGMVLQPAQDGLHQFLALRTGHRHGQGILEGGLVKCEQPGSLLRGERVVIQVKTALEGKSQIGGVPVQEPQVEI